MILDVFGNYYFNENRCKKCKEVIGLDGRKR